MKNRIAELERAMGRQKVTTLAKFVIWECKHSDEPCPGGDLFLESAERWEAEEDEQEARLKSEIAEHVGEDRLAIWLSRIDEPSPQFCIPVRQ